MTKTPFVLRFPSADSAVVSHIICDCRMGRLVIQPPTNGPGSSTTCNCSHDPMRADSQFHRLHTRSLVLMIWRQLTVVIIVGYHCCLLHMKFYPRLSPYVDEIIGDHQCGFRRNRWTTDQISFLSFFFFFAFVRYWRKNGSTMRQYISYS
jgi:hypothetical protein